MKSLGFVMLVLAAGCVTTHPDPPPPPLPELAACAPQACETGATATEAAHLNALIAGAEWPALGDYTTGCLPASKNIPIAGAITLRGADHGGKFRLRGLPAGLECSGRESYWDFTVCEDITLTDTTIRIRTVVQDVHPAPGNHLRLVEILDACEVPCGDGEFTCEANNTCWPTLRDHCAYCLGGSNDACACWTGEDFAADGTTCSLAISGDIIAGGACYAGRCETAQ